VKKLASKPAHLITAILIGNNLVNVWATVMAGQIASNLALTLGYDPQAGWTAGVLVGAVTILVLIFGEVVPKQYAIQHNEGLALSSAPVVFALTVLFRPAIWVLTWIASLAIKLFGGHKRAPVTLEGLIQLVNLAKSLGILRRDEQQILHNTFRFKDVTARQVLTHRTEIFSLSQEESLHQAMPKILEQGFSRIPLFDPEDTERITGIVLIKDLLTFWSKPGENPTLKELMVSPLYIPSSRKAKAILEDFRSEGINMAIVLDEYGGLAGLITREDIIEEIMGELYDEDEDQEEEKILPLGKDSYLISGDAPIHMVQEELGLKLEAEDSVSFGGYIIEQTGHIPQRGEKILLPIGPIVIRKMDKLQISLVEYSRKGQ